MSKTINFLKDVKAEMGRVSWPTRKQTTKYTLTILGMVLFTAVFLGGLDFVFQFLLNKAIIK